MAKLESNLSAVVAEIDRLVQSFDFTIPGKDQSLGRDLAGVVAMGIRDRSVPGRKAPDGSTWDDNEPRYAAKKRAKYDADQPNVRTGQMLSLESLKGRTAISADDVTMEYGTDTPAASALNGTTLTKGDTAVTDVEKAGYCSERRPFYGLDDTIGDAVRTAAAEALGDYLRDA